MGFTLIFDAWRFGGQMSLKNGVLKKMIWSHCGWPFCQEQFLEGGGVNTYLACIKSNTGSILTGNIQTLSFISLDYYKIVVKIVSVLPGVRTKNGYIRGIFVLQSILSILQPQEWMQNAY